MSNEMVSFGLEDEKLLQELQYKKIMAMGQQLKNLQETISIQHVEIETQKRDISNIKESLNFGISEVKEVIQKQIEKTSYQEQKTGKDYLGLGPLGATHSPLIGAVYMGKLLRKVGICCETGQTRPQSKYTNGDNPLVINATTNEGYMSFYYHYKRTWEIVKKHLAEMGYIDKFEACKNKDEIHTFINEIN